MGAEPYFYFVKYQSDINAALQALRKREFKAGRYNPVLDLIDFPLDSESPAPGADHDSIEEAIEAAGADGTRSILDIESVSDEPEFCTASPVPDETLIGLYGTTEPTRKMIEENDEFLEDVERGHAVYIIVYNGGKPDEIYFGGLSFD